MSKTFASTNTRKLELSPVCLPLCSLDAAAAAAGKPDDLAAALAELGYQGFAHLKKSSLKNMNPAELVAAALSHNDLDPRIIEALPWVLVTFWNLDWTWLTARCRLLKLQNRLGLLLELGSEFASPEIKRVLHRTRLDLETYRLATEDTLCRSSMSAAEREWIRNNRSSAAGYWNLLTTLSVNQLKYAP